MTVNSAPADLLAAFHDSLNAGPDLDLLALLLAPDYRHDVGGAVVDRVRYLAMQQAFCEGFSCFSVERSTVLVDGAWVASYVVASGTHTGTFLGHPPSGRSFSAAGIDMFRVEDGRLAEGRGVFDTIAMLCQLGLYREVTL